MKLSEQYKKEEGKMLSISSKSDGFTRNIQ